MAKVNNCKCEVCEKGFHAKPSRLKRSNVRYCSLKCKHKGQVGRVAWNKGKPLGFLPKKAFKKGHIPWNKGKSPTQETRDKISKSKKGVKVWGGSRKNMTWNKGNKSASWKGDDAKSGAIHMWIYSRLGKPDTCEHCGKSGLTGYQIHWSNKDHKYKRNFDDWQRLCALCHRRYDMENNGR